MTTSVEIREADVDGRILDVSWRDGVVVDVRPWSSQPISADAQVLDASGGALIPGLHDHHIHLLALAAARQSVEVGPPWVRSRGRFVDVLGEACRAPSDGWVRAVGYHESVAGDLDADVLDQLIPAGHDVAIRVQHRSGQLWVLNRRAVALARIGDIGDSRVERDRDGTPTGRLFGLDDQLRDRIPAPAPDLAPIGSELASYGVTSITDMTPTESTSALETLAEQATESAFPVRITVTGGPALSRSAASSLERGPVKFLPADHDPPDLAALASGFETAHREGRPVAVHSVSRTGIVVVLAAWHEVGARPGDRIEHGAVIPRELMDEIRDLGLLVVTQPNFVFERGDQYLTDVEPHDLPDLWRCRSLLDHGIAVAGGTDAPFGHPDPWRAIAAAGRRRTRDGSELGPDERLPPRTALELYLGRASFPTVIRRITPGERTDLCLLDRPLDDALSNPTAAVRATIGRAGVKWRDAPDPLSDHLGGQL